MSVQSIGPRNKTVFDFRLAMLITSLDCYGQVLANFRYEMDCIHLAEMAVYRRRRFCIVVRSRPRTCGGSVSQKHTLGPCERVKDPSLFQAMTVDQRSHPGWCKAGK
jgi:hypothetical protein